MCVFVFSTTYSAQLGKNEKDQQLRNKFTTKLAATVQVPCGFFYSKMCQILHTILDLGSIFSDIFILP